MLHQWLRCLLLVPFLGFLAGCSESPRKPSVAVQGDGATKPLAQDSHTQQPAKPGFPLAGPPGVTAASTPPQASAPQTHPGTAAQPGYNTRPVGPYGIRSITLGLNDLHQAGLLLVAFYNENNGWPRNENELREALREMPLVYKAIQTGDYVFVPLKVPNTMPNAQNVLIYEKLPDKAGFRLVLFGDSSVKRLSNAEFSQLKLPPS